MDPVRLAATEDESSSDMESVFSVLGLPLLDPLSDTALGVSLPLPLGSPGSLTSDLLQSSPSAFSHSDLFISSPLLDAPAAMEGGAAEGPQQTTRPGGACSSQTHAPIMQQPPAAVHPRDKSCLDGGGGGWATSQTRGHGNTQSQEGSSTKRHAPLGQWKTPPQIQYGRNSATGPLPPASTGSMPHPHEPQSQQQQQQMAWTDTPNLEGGGVHQPWTPVVAPAAASAPRPFAPTVEGGPADSEVTDVGGASGLLARMTGLPPYSASHTSAHETQQQYALQQQQQRQPSVQYGHSRHGSAYPQQPALHQQGQQHTRQPQQRRPPPRHPPNPAQPSPPQPPPPPASLVNTQSDPPPQRQQLLQQQQLYNLPTPVMLPYPPGPPSGVLQVPPPITIPSYGSVSGTQSGTMALHPRNQQQQQGGRQVMPQQHTQGLRRPQPSARPVDMSLLELHKTPSDTLRVMKESSSSSIAAAQDGLTGEQMMELGGSLRRQTYSCPDLAQLTSMAHNTSLDSPLPLLAGVPESPEPPHMPLSSASSMMPVAPPLDLSSLAQAHSMMTPSDASFDDQLSLSKLRAIVSCPDMLRGGPQSSHHDLAPDADERRQQKLARNRAAARERRMRTKNQMEAYEHEATILEAEKERLQQHKWGMGYSKAALLEALGHEKVFHVMTPEACRQATEGLLRQQLQHVRGLREDVLLLEALRSAVSSSQHTPQIGGKASMGRGGMIMRGDAQVDYSMLDHRMQLVRDGTDVEEGVDEAEMQILGELMQELELSPEQMGQLSSAMTGLEAEEAAVAELEQTLQEIWPVATQQPGQAVTAALQLFHSMMDGEQLGSLLDWADANRSAISRLDIVTGKTRAAPSAHRVDRRRGGVGDSTLKRGGRHQRHARGQEDEPLVFQFSCEPTGGHAAGNMVAGGGGGTSSG